MEFDKSVPFKNYSSTKFIGIYDGTSYEFEAGATYNVPFSMAAHFAKGLAVRELHALGTIAGEMLTEQDIQAYTDKCFPTKPSSPTNSNNSFERIDVVEEGKAEQAPVVEANKTFEVEQHETSDDDEDDVDDEKNNAGAPVFKKPIGRPRKDAQYTQ